MEVLQEGRVSGTSCGPIYIDVQITIDRKDQKVCAMSWVALIGVRVRQKWLGNRRKVLGGAD